MTTRHLVVCVIAAMMSCWCIGYVNAQSPRLFATTADDNSVLYQLSSVDASVVKRIGSTGLKITALAWHPYQAMIWAAAGGALWQLNPSTGASSFIVSLTDTNTVVALTFSSTLQLSAAFSATPDASTTLPYLVHINTVTGVCTRFVDEGFGVRSGLAYDDVDNLWFRRDQSSPILNVTYTGELIDGASLDGLAGSDDSLTAAGLTCASNDVCYTLVGDPSINPLPNSATSGIATLITSTGWLTEIGRTGITSTLRGLVAEALGVYFEEPSSATQGVARSMLVYARPAFQVPITFTFVSSSNHDLLAESDITVTTVDSSSTRIDFTSSTQGVTKLKWTAVDVRGRTVTNTLPLAILPSPKLTSPPSEVLAIVGQNGTLAISDLQGLDGVTIVATSTGDLQLWANATSVHWYAPTATSQTVTVTASNVYGGINTVTFVVNPIASVPCLSL